MPLLYIPEMCQQVYGDSAFVSGLFILPMMIGLVAAKMACGQLIARNGRYKIYPRTGGLPHRRPLYLLSRFTATTPAVWMLFLLAVAGAGLGMFVQVALVAGQNDVAPSDLGVATGALNFSKTLGGALGSAIFGAILTAGLRHQARPDVSAYVRAYHDVFLWTVPVMAVSLVLALVMREGRCRKRCSRS